MTAYEYDNLPESMEFIDALPEGMFEAARAVIAQAAEGDEILATEAKIAWAYDRKGYMSLDTFGGNRNPSYSSSGDDLIIQLTVRVKGTDKRWNPMPLIAELEERVTETRRAAKQAELEAEIAAAEAEATRAEARAAERRAQLEALRNQQK